jgi:hypothetical protein
MLLHLFRRFFNPTARAPQRVQMRSRYTVECVAPDGSLRWSEQFENLVVTTGLNALLGNTFDAAAGSVLWYVGLIGAGTGTVAITSGAAAITGTSTDFQATDVGSDLIIVGAGAAGADLITTVLSRSSTTAAVANANASATVTGASYALEPRPADTMASKSFNETTPYSDANRPAWTKNGAPSGGAMSNSSSKAAFTINATGRVFGAFLSSSNTKGGTTGTLYGGGLFSTGSRSVLNGDTLNVQVDLSATAA